MAFDRRKYNQDSGRAKDRCRTAYHGWSTALNLAMEADKQGVWEKYNIRMIGVDVAAIELAEDREQFRNHVKTLGMSVPPSYIANSFS